MGLKAIGRAWLIALVLSVMTPVVLADTERQIEDILGRTVTVPAKIEGIILGESRFIPALGIVDDQAGIPRIKGMLADLKQYDPATWAHYAERFPALEDIALIGQGSAASFSVEKAIELAPDVAIFGISGHGPSPRDQQLLAPLQAAGIPVVFIDFREQPLQHTTASVRILGQLLGREDRAEAFNRLYQQQLQMVRERVAAIPAEERPRVFLHSKVGLFAECCETMGDTMLGVLLSAAGGQHMGAELIPGQVGNVNIEHLLTHPPERYLATAIGSGKLEGAASPFVRLGADVSPAQARQSLTAATQAMPVSNLEAVREGRMFAVWHHFYNSPFNIAALVAMAQWLHPAVFADMDADALLQRLYRDFQPVPLTGTYWIAADPGVTRP